MTNIVKVKYLDNYKRIMNEAVLKKATTGSSCFDLYAVIDEPIVLAELQTVIIPTGISLEMIENSEARVLSRSGLAAKEGVFVLNAPGIIDYDYKDEVKVILSKVTKGAYIIKPKDRIAQIGFFKLDETILVKTGSLSLTDRKGGLGSTGK